MTQKRAFSQVIDVLRPLMKGIRRLGEFAAGIVDMGLVPAADGTDERTALELRAEATWKGYANGSARLSTDLAGEIAGRWEPAKFAENLISRYEEPALNSLAENLHAVDKSINKGNVAEGLGNLLLRVFEEASGQVPVVNSPEIEAVAKADRDGHAYFDHVTGRIRLADHSVGVPAKKPVPVEMQPEELGYVTPLLHAYCEDLHRQGSKVSVDDIPERLARHFQEQRKAFYSNEWLRETSWNCFDNGQAVFETYIDSMYAGVTDTNMRSYPNGVERLFATLAQAANVQLDRFQLAQVIDLIDVWAKKGSCHQLASNKQLRWAD